MNIRRILLLSLLHFVVQIGVFASSFSVGMTYFDSLEEPSIASRILDRLSEFLMLPLVKPLISIWPKGWRGFPLEHLPFILNSLVWGLVISWVIGRLKRRRSAL